MNLEDIFSSLQPPKRRYYRAFFKNQVLGAENLGSHRVVQGRTQASDKGLLATTEEDTAS